MTPTLPKENSKVAVTYFQHRFNSGICDCAHGYNFVYKAGLIKGIPGYVWIFVSVCNLFSEVFETRNTYTKALRKL